MILLGIAALQFFIGILEPFFVDIGINPEPIRFIRHAHLAPLGLAFLVLIGMQGAMTSVARPVAGWLVWVVVAMISMLIIGLLRGVFFSAALLDAGIYEAFVVAFLVGARHENWKIVHRFFAVLFYSGVVIMAVELLLIESAVRDDSISSVAYHVRSVLFAWPLLLFTAGTAPRFQKLGTAAGMGLIVLMYVLFQKRAPTVRVAFALLLFLWLVPGVVRAVRMKLRLFVVAGTLSVLLFSGFMASTQSESANVVSESSMALADRFQGSSGFMDTLTKENQRWEEAKFFFNEASELELVFGKGFGGAVPVAWWWSPGLDITEDGRTFHGVYSMHIGLSHPLLKGGFFFWCIFFGGWVMLLFRLKRYRSDPRAVACWAVVLLNFVFMSVETLWGSSNVVTVILIGFCMGYLGNRKFWGPVKDPNTPKQAEVEA
jgi:hypothetical protein